MTERRFLILIFGLALVFILAHPVFAELVRPDMARGAGITHLRGQEGLWMSKPGLAPKAFAEGQRFSVLQVRTLKGSDGRTLAYILDLNPEGYVAVSADTDICPVIAYSSKGTFPMEDTSENALLHLLTWDMENRLEALPVTSQEVKQENNVLWSKYLAGEEDFIQQLASTKTWGHWLTTTWKQSGIYNDKCPKDPITNSECKVGCTATAMAQIINYWTYPVSVSFNSTDEYTSKNDPNDEKGERVIEIDGDHTTLDFPSFTTLTEELSNIVYKGNEDEIAYLCFACGVSRRMRYSSKTSYAAIDNWTYRNKWNYASAEYDWGDVNSVLQKNMKDAMPAQMSISKEEDGEWKGHTIVVDGYKDNDQYHLNYGWGEDNCIGWYSFPHGMPDKYKTVDGVIVDITPYIWPTFRGNRRHTGRSIWAGPHDRNLQWRFDGGGLYSSPVVAKDGTIYVGSGENKFYAIKNSDGSKKWELGTGNLVVSAAAIGRDGTIYASCTDDILYAINPNGTQKWTFIPGGELSCSPAIARDGTIYIGSTNGNLYALEDLGYASQKWSIDCGGSTHLSAPAIGKDGIIYVGAGSNLVAISPDGTKNWSINLGSTVQAAPAIGNNEIIYAGTTNGKLYAVSWSYLMGAYVPIIDWEFTAGDSIISSPAIGYDGTIYVGSLDSKLYAVQSDGNKKWEFVTGGAIWSSPAIDTDGIIYVGSDDKKVYALQDDGDSASKRWEFLAPNEVYSSPAIGDNRTIYVGSDDDRLYAIGGINHAPTLDWTGETNYGSDGLNPETSTSTSNTFVYRVKYIDADNHFPLASWPKVYIKKGSSAITGSPFTMSEVDSLDIDCIDGKLYTFSKEGLAEGDDYKYYFEAYDDKNAKATGTPTSTKYGPIVDATPPDTSITYGPSGAIIAESNNVTFSWTGSDNITATPNLVYSYKLGSAAWSGWTSNTHYTCTCDEGTYTFKVKAKDELGNVDASPAEQTFTVDGTAPVNPDRSSCTETNGASDNTWQNSVSNPNFTWSEVDDAAGYYWYFGTNSSGEPTYWTTTAGCDPPSVVNGTYYLRIKTKDEVGNVSSPTTLFTFKYDGTAPGQPSITSGPGHDWSNNNTPTFIWSCSDSGGSGVAKYWYRTDSESWQWTTGTSVQVSLLADGLHNFYVKAEDGAGNIGVEAAYDFKIDTVLPVASLEITNVGAIEKDDTVYFDGSASTDDRGIAKYYWYFGDYTGSYWETADNAPDGSFDGMTTYIYGVKGVYTVYLSIYDLAGNIGIDSAEVNIKSKPVATIQSIAPVPAIGGQKVNFSGTAWDPDGDSIDEWSWRSDVDGQLATSPGFSTTELTPSDSTPHNIYFKAKDSDGFWSDEAQWSQPLWIYLPKKWDMFKKNDTRLSSQQNYPDTIYGTLNYAPTPLFPAGSPIEGSPVAANLDNNWANGLEIAFVTTGGTLIVTDSIGTLLWSKSLGSTFGSTPAIEDIDADGNLDVVVASLSGLDAFDRNGNSIYPTFSAAVCSGFGHAPVVADIQPLSLGKETVIRSSNGNVYAIKSNGQQLWVFGPTGGGGFTSSPAVADIDVHSGLETVVGGTDGTLYVIDSGGSQIASFTPPAPGPICTTPAIADIVPSKVGPEIVFGTNAGFVYCLNYNNGVLSSAWQYPAPGSPLLPIISSPAIGRPGEWGDVHVVFGCNNGNVYVLDGAKGLFVSSYSCPSPVWSTPAIANIDTVIKGPNDEDFPEVIFADTNGVLYAVNFSQGWGQNLPWSPLSLCPGQPIRSSPAVADLNHDPELEILIGAGNGFLYMIRATTGANQNPVAVTDPNHIGLTGQPLVLDASASYDLDEPNGDYVAKYIWQINNPLTYPAFETYNAVATISWSELNARGVSEANDFPVSLVVNDSFGASSTAVTATIAIRDSVDAPTADPNGPYQILIGEPVTFDGSASTAAESGNYIASFAWDLDNDSVFDDAFVEKVSLSWQSLEALGITAVGEHPIKLKVTDKLGQESTPAETTLTVFENNPPVDVNAGGPYVIEEGASVSLSATGYDPDVNDAIVAYEWDIDANGLFGDCNGPNVTVPWSTLAAGCSGRGADNPNPIRVRAYDTYGYYGTSGPALLYIYINEPIAIAKANGSAEPISVMCGESIVFNHSQSYHQWPSQHSIVLYEWDFDGNEIYDWSTSNPAEQYTSVYPVSGVYNATLRVTDDNPTPKTAIDTIEINVVNNPPFADPGGPYNVPFTDAVTLAAGASSDPDGTIISFMWDLDDDGSFDDGTGVNLALTWANLENLGLSATGTSYSIGLSVTDNQGADDSALTTLTVIKEDVVIGHPWCIASYSDQTPLEVAINDNDGNTLKKQLALPKTCYLEVYDGADWQLLSQDTLISSDDTDQTAAFTLQIQQGLVDVAPGPSEIRVRFDGDSDYNSKTQTATLTLNKEEVSISEPAVTVIYGSSLPVQLTVLDDDGENLYHQSSAPKTVSIEVYDANESSWLLIGEDTLSSVDNSDNTVDYTISIGPEGLDWLPGSYSLRAKFDGDDYYEPTTSGGTLTVAPRLGQFIDDIDAPADDWNWTVTYSEANTISCRLVDYNGGNLLCQADEPKIVYLDVNSDGEWLTITTDALSAVDDSDDTLEFICEIQEGLVDVPPAVRPIRFRFDGDSRYAPCIQQAILTIQKEDTQFIDPNGGWQWSFPDDTNEHTIHIKLLDDDGEPLYHIGDEPKRVYADYNDNGNWINFDSYLISELVPGDASQPMASPAERITGYDSSVTGDEPQVEDAYLRFFWQYGIGWFDIRFRFEGDTYYNPTSAAGVAVFGPANAVYVPQEYPTIQQAIDAACDGGIVVVADGTYSGPNNTNLTWDATVKHITIMSQKGPDNCIIDCQGVGRGFYFNNTGQNNTDIIDGFTITDANADIGGGIYCCEFSSPIIIDCTIIANTADYGAGIADVNSTPALINCTFVGNCADQAGGGMYNCNCNPTLTNCIFSSNWTAGDGGAMYNDSSSPVVTNCTFNCNTAEGIGGGIYNLNVSNPTLSNSILWGDIPDEISAIGGATTAVTYSDIQGGFEGDGNINTDPCFVGLPMVSYWKFDEGSGTTAGDSADDNPGTISGPTWTTGKVGPALYFHGGGQWASASDIVQVAHCSNLDITGPFTAEAWIKATGSDTYLMIVQKQHGSQTVSDGFSFYLAAGKARLTICSSGDYYVDLYGTSELRDDTWHYVVALWDGSFMKIYVDGIQEGKKAWPYPPASTSQPLAIGKRPDGWGGYLPFLGTIDEVAIYDRALSTDEIQQHYQYGLLGLGYPVDYHLRCNSPCIDAGSNAAVSPDTADLDGDTNTTEPIPYDLDGHPRFIDGDCNGTAIVDMGTYEFSCIGDFDFSGSVDVVDFAIFALTWLSEPGDDNWNPLCDISNRGDNSIDWVDLAIFADSWLSCK